MKRANLTESISITLPRDVKKATSFRVIYNLDVRSLTAGATWNRGARAQWAAQPSRKTTRIIFFGAAQLPPEARLSAYPE